MLTPKTRSTESLPYEFRLHYPWQYRRFFNQSQPLRLSQCTIFRIPNELGHFRLGITLKSRGSSIERNRVKRAIREAMRKHRELLDSYDYNVVVPSSRKMTHVYAGLLAGVLEKELPGAIRGKAAP